MKRVKNFISLLLVTLCILALLPFAANTASAASNPYPTSQTVGGVVTIPCTYYAWQQAYERLGIALPAWGNAINWYNAAANAGYSVGTTPQANSIAVWSSSSHSYGHVGFVTAVNGSQMTVNEGGRTDATANGGIVNGQNLPSTANTTWYGRTLIGFIYLSGTPSVSASWTEYPDKWSVSSTNAVLSARVNLNVDISAVSKVGVYLYDYAGKALATCSENTSHGGYSYMNMWFDVNSELHYTLVAGTPYQYKFYAVIGGKTYESPVSSFKTPGAHSHTYDSGSITKAPTCSAMGIKTFTCTICGATKTETIAKLKNHTYTNDADTSCNTCGAKAYPGGNTLVKENGIWYHIVNRQKVNDTTLVYYGGYWFYVKNGQVDWTSNTLCKWNGKWWHVKGGQVAYDTTLVKYGGYWFYVKNGQVDFNATTLCYYGGYWFYVKNGQVDFNATTLCYYGGYWFYVKNGQVDWTSNTLCKWNGKWWHVKGGQVAYDTTLVYFAGDWYYVKSGIVDFSYSGRVLFSGKYYTVKNGVKV